MEDRRRLRRHAGRAATDAAFESLGIEADSTPQVPAGRRRACREVGGRGRNVKARVAPTAAPARKTSEGPQQAMLVAMLERTEGAALAQVVEATGWQPHTVP